MPSTESSKRPLHTLLTGLVFPEQPRWHEGRLWFSDWGTQEVIAVDLNPDMPLHAGNARPIVTP